MSTTVQMGTKSLTTKTSHYKQPAQSLQQWQMLATHLSGLCAAQTQVQISLQLTNTLLKGWKEYKPLVSPS